MKRIIDPSICEPVIYGLPVGMGIFSTDLVVLWMNSSLSTLFGYQPDEVIGKKWLSLIPATEERQQRYARVLAGEALDYPEARSPLGEAERCFDVRYRPLRDSDKTIKGMLATCIEITDRKRIERQLVESETKLRRLSEELDRIFAFSPDMICISGLDGYFKRVNPAFARTLGHSEQALLKTPYIEFVHPDDRERTTAQADRTAAGNPIIRFENRYRCHDGTYKWLAWRSVTDLAEQLIYAVARDMTDVKQAQQAVEDERLKADRLRKMYLKQVLSAQEEERRRIARELHDDTGSSLTSLVVGLRSLSALDIPEKAMAQLQRLQEIAENTVDSVSRVAHGLHPSALEDLGLRAALERYASEYAQVNQTQVHVYIKRAAKAETLPLTVATTVYRIIQESLTNVAKHAKAENVSVILDGDKASIRLIIEDDGRGFPESALEDSESTSGIGIQGIRERLSLLGGALTIESIFGGGTTLFVMIPRPRDEDSGRDEAAVG